MHVTITEQLAELFSPLPYLLLAYALADPVQGAEHAAKICGMLRVEAVPETSSQAWELYAEHEAQTISFLQQYGQAEGVVPVLFACERLDLSTFERVALLLALAVEVEPLYAALIAQMEGGLTLSFLLRLFSSSAEECLSLHAEWVARREVLRHLFHCGGLAERVTLHPTARLFLLGLDCTPQGMTLFTPGETRSEPWLPSELPAAMQRGLRAVTFPAAVLLHGEKGVGKRFLLRCFAAETGMRLLFVPNDKLPATQEERDALTTLLLWTNSCACLCNVSAEKAQELLQECAISAPSGLLFVTSEEPLRVPLEGISTLPLAVPSPNYAERLALWHIHAGDLLDVGILHGYASQYKFTAGQILAACAMVQRLAVLHGRETVSAPLMHEACRMQLSHELEKLATPIQATYTWDDIILPPAQVQLLRHVCDQVLYRDTVFGTWGFERSLAYGRGVRALFSGPPGTGKTMAAQIVAAELQRQLFRVDSSSLVSKYIGETEKNIDELFRHAADSAGVLFFDEADAIFGKRGEQRDSHDRYANMQTAFLLQKFEDFDGVVILATNLISNFDPAFLRRIQNRVDFPMPTEPFRKRIWDSLCLETAPFSADVDTAFLAREFELSGSAIKSIVLQAAFLAAAQGAAIGMGELLQALTLEYAKTDKLIARGKLGEYAYSLPDTLFERKR